MGVDFKTSDHIHHILGETCKRPVTKTPSFPTHGCYCFQRSELQGLLLLKHHSQDHHNCSHSQILQEMLGDHVERAFWHWVGFLNKKFCDVAFKCRVTLERARKETQVQSPHYFSFPALHSCQRYVWNDYEMVSCPGILMYFVPS